MAYWVHQGGMDCRDGANDEQPDDNRRCEVRVERNGTVRAVAAGGAFTFDGRYSNADVAAIADAFTVKTGKRPSSAWLADLRYTESARNDGACYEGKILDRQDAAFGDYL